MGKRKKEAGGKGIGEERVTVEVQEGREGREERQGRRAERGKKGERRPHRTVIFKSWHL